MRRKANETRPGRPVDDVRRDLDRRGLLELVAMICADHGVMLEDIASGTKLRSIVHARQHVFAAIRAIARLSFTEIGDLFGRDHSTAQHGIAAHHRRAETSPPVFRVDHGGFGHMGVGAGI